MWTQAHTEEERMKTKGNQGHPQARKTGIIFFFPWQLSQETNSADILISKWQPPELWDNKSLLFKPLVLCVLCHSRATESGWLKTRFSLPISRPRFWNQIQVLSTANVYRGQGRANKGRPACHLRMKILIYNEKDCWIVKYFLLT